MTCTCLDRIEQYARGRTQEARRRAEHELPMRLSAFAEAMKEGAVGLVARRLVRAGVFRASLDAQGAREVAQDACLNAVQTAVDGHGPLEDFYATHRKALQEQMDFVDPKELLRGPTRVHSGRMERLGSLLGAELRAAEEMMVRLETLQERLPAWTAQARAAAGPRVERITDPHEGARL